MGKEIRVPLQPRTIPLRWVLVIPLAIQTAAIAALMAWLSWQSGQRTLEILANRLQREAASRVADYLGPRLSLPQEMTRLVAFSIRNQQIDMDDPQGRYRAFWNTLNTLESIDNLAWGDVEGNYTSVQFDADRSSVLLYERRRSPGDPERGDLVSYVLDREGNRQNQLDEFPNFDPRDRPWYREGSRAGRAVWSPIFPFFSNSNVLVLATSYPVYDPFGNLQGVLSARVYLSDLNQFLQRLQVSETGLAFVVDEGHQLVAASVATPLLAPVRPDGTGRPGPARRVAAHESAHPTIRAIAQALSQRRPLPAPGDHNLDLTLQGKRYLVRELPFRDDYGLRWRIVVAIPEEDFANQIIANKHTMLLSLAIALLGSITLSTLTARWLQRPIQRLVRAADEMAQGAWHVHLPKSRIDELDHLAIAFQTTAGHLQQIFGELERQATTDPLTGLLNRTGFSSQLEHLLSDAGRPQRPFALLFLDLDDFKVVNDTLGHPIGDRLLIEVAQRIRHTLPPQAILGRFGGDEFTILLPSTPPQAAAKVAEAICNALNTPFTLHGHAVFARTSIGLVHSDTATAQRAGDALRDADLALYSAKRQGKSRYAPFDDTMRQQSLNRFELESDLHRAIDRGELETFYQPIISLRTGQITCFEALLRWRHPSRGFISPTVFIPIAEETGAIIELGEWVLERACQQTQQWRSDATLQKQPRIAVNCSIVQLGRSNFADRVLAIVNRSQLGLGNLTLEITESLLMQGADFAQSHLEILSAQGIQLSIDDFGTGYSSLSYLHRLPLNSLKIDRSFISDLGTNPRNTSIVRAIITLAHQLDLAVVAEGVSSTYHVSQLRAMRCNSAQGFLMSPPVDAGRATKLLRRATLLS